MCVCEHAWMCLCTHLWRLLVSIFLSTLHYHVPPTHTFFGGGVGWRKCLSCTCNSKIKSDWITSKPQGSACLCHIFHQTPPPSTLELEIQSICLDFVVLVCWLVGWLVFFFALEATHFVGLADLELTIESRLTSTCLNLSNARIIKT